MKYERKYLRDGRAPIPEDPKVSYTMSRIKGKNTKPELAVRKGLWARGVRGYRLHPKTVPGKPDISFVGMKKAVFIHGCYWHSCPHCKPKNPKTHSEFWKEKFRKNKERDERKELELIALGWEVLTLWECQIKADLENALDRVENLLA